MADESILIYDVKIRVVWAVKGSRPRQLATGSHRRIVVLGALAEDGTQLFRTSKNADGSTFLNYLKQLHRKYSHMVLYLDKATYHKKDKKVQAYLKKHRKNIRIRWFPSGFPESNPVEECWNQGKNELIGSRFHNTFQDFKNATITYYRTKRFKLDLYKYLCQ